jgi:hypothetical protein
VANIYLSYCLQKNPPTESQSDEEEAQKQDVKSEEKKDKTKEKKSDTKRSHRSATVSATDPGLPMPQSVFIFRPEGKPDILQRIDQAAAVGNRK